MRRQGCTCFRTHRLRWRRSARCSRANSRRCRSAWRRWNLIVAYQIQVNAEGGNEPVRTWRGASRAGRKVSSERKVKRSVSLSARADALVLSAMQADETYSQTLDRLICARIQRAEPNAQVALLVATLSSRREGVAEIYRRLGWTRQAFERLVQAHREGLGRAGVRLHVATKEAASGRRERYITVDGMRYSALSRDSSGP